MTAVLARQRVNRLASIIAQINALKGQAAEMEMKEQLFKQFPERMIGNELETMEVDLKRINSTINDLTVALAFPE